MWTLSCARHKAHYKDLLCCVCALNLAHCKVSQKYNKPLNFFLLCALHLGTWQMSTLSCDIKTHGKRWLFVCLSRHMAKSWFGFRCARGIPHSLTTHTLTAVADACARRLHPSHRLCWCACRPILRPFRPPRSCRCRLSRRRRRRRWRTRRPRPRRPCPTGPPCCLPSSHVRGGGGGHTCAGVGVLDRRSC